MEGGGELPAVSVLPTVYRIASVPPLLLILLWCWYRWKYRRVIAEACKLAVELPALPVIGHLYLIAFGLTGLMSITVESGKALARKREKTTCMWLGPYPIIFVNDPEDIYTLVTSSKTSEKSNEYGFLNFFLGNGLLIAPGAIHRVTRRHINPMFLPRNLEQLFPVFNASARHLVCELSKCVGQGEVNVLKPVAMTALKNVVCVMFGADLRVDTESEDFQNFFQAIEDVSAALLQRVLKPWLWSDTTFYYFWKTQVDNINNARRKIAESTLRDYAAKKSVDVQRPLNLLDAFEALRKTQPDLTEQDLHNEILTLGITGTESTKSVVSSCMLALAANPDIQERLYQEVVSVVGAENTEVEPHVLNNMPYLDQVFKETIRYFTVVPIFARKTLQDIQFKELFVPAGSTVACNLMGLHYNSDVFPNPETFDPDNFSPDNVARMKRYAFLPFSGGSRSCIGKVYATMFMKTLMIHILRKFRLSTSVDITSLKFNIGLAMVSENGYHIELHNRNPIN